MSFFDEASLVMIPSGYKDQKVYSVKPTDGTGDLTFSRASDATRVASDGLIEKVRTNLALYSEQFDNAYWGKSAVTVTANNTTDPFGGSAADKVLCDAGTASPNIFSGAVNCVSGVEYTASYYAKQGTSKYAKIRFSSTAFASSTNSPIFDLNAGTVVSGTGTITSVGNGWYRISATQVAESSATGVFTVDIPSSTGVWPNGTFAGTEFIYIFGYQFEENVSVSPYIATTSAAVSVGPVSGLPRLDYLNSSCPRLLLEPQRTNVAQYSEQFNNAWWAASNSTISANAVVSPDGYTNADNIVENTANSTHGVGNLSGLTLTAAAYTLSVFVKKQTRNFFAISTYDGSTTLEGYFNINTGAVATMPAGLTGSIVSYGNGWYRCSVTRTMGANSDNYFAFNAAPTDGGSTYTGTSAIACSLYGATIELGAYATSYIPTLGTSVTRVADAASKTGISSLLSASEYTLFWEGTHIPTSQFNSFMTISQTSNANNSARFYRNNTDNQIRATIFNSVNGLSLDLASGITAQTAKCALRVKAGSYAFYVNGTLVASNASALAPFATLDQINLQYFESSQSFDQRTAQALFFKTGLTNAQLAELTA